MRSGSIDVYHDSAGKLRIDAICEQCGEPFKSRRNGHSPTGWTRYCSRACVSRARGGTPGRKRKNWADLSEETRHKRRQKARARHRNRQLTGDGVTDEQILERDRWMCRMDTCIYGSRRINPKRKYPDQRSASIDHIVPLALGGDDTAFNKRAAHLGCNMARGTGRPGEQMTLDFITAAPVTRERRKRVSRPRPPRPCRTCGEVVKGKCELHEPVRYANCKRCDAPVIKRGTGRICQACKTRPCAVPACDRPVFFAATDWCAAHHHRHSKYGDVLAHIPVAADRVERIDVMRLRVGVTATPAEAGAGVCQLCETYPLRSCCAAAS
jgi:hypothetical protein